MRIAAQSTIAASEKVLQALEHSPPGEPLRLPSNPRHLAGGAEAALAQVIVSWAQRNPEALLETYIESDDQIDDFVRRFTGLVGALCMSEATNRNASRSITGLLRSAALTRLSQLQSERPKKGYRGTSAEILCADHLGRDTPYLLYMPQPRGGSGLRPRENFRDLAKWLLRGSIPGGYHQHLPLDAAEAIGSMLFEVFKNTEDHALSDLAGNLLSISIRAIKTTHHAMSPEQMSRVVGDYAPLARYCDQLSVPRGALYTHLFELSVIDSGPGFAATWTGTALSQMSLKEEEAAVRACFGRGSAKGQSRFGEGLPHVLRLLHKQKGFLRLRTGRLSFYIDFSASEEAADDCLLLYAEEDPLPLAPVAGSLLTILIPMRRVE